MKKILLLAVITAPTFTLASATFISEGVGFYCYQDRAGALENAKQDADSNAQKVCETRDAVRISKYKVVPNNPGTNSCGIVVQAKYKCQ